MRWGVWILIVALPACGRIGFDNLSDGGGGDGSDGDGGSPLRMRSLSAGLDFSCAIRNERAVCWGRNTQGQLGDGTTMMRTVPTEVALPPGKVTHVRTGSLHACAVLDGLAYCWGANNSGELGTTGGGISPQPIKINLPANITAVGAGDGFSCALSGGTISCWGNDSNERVGNGDGLLDTEVPMPVAGMPTVRAMSIGNDHGCGISSSGVVHCWGHNDQGLLGTGSSIPSSTGVAMQVTILGPVTAFTLGATHACALEADHVVCWGDNSSGQLGDNGFASSLTPVMPIGLDARVTQIDSGGGEIMADGSCAIVNNAVACWGGGAAGRLGNGTTNPERVRTFVGGLPTVAPTEISLGENHGCATFIDDSTWCWGAGSLGQLGDGRATSSLVPVRVTGT